ncbi:MAG: hypothetical protein AB8B73_04500 [Ekhidna sp.]
MSKSLKYIVLIVVLLIANMWLFFADSWASDSKTTTYFNAEDMSSVSMIQFVLENEVVKIERSEQGWTLNDEFKADDGFVTTLISVLQRVDVSRVVGSWEQEILGSVEVEFDFNSRYRFDFASNATRTKSYFIDEGVAKEVSVPGYRDNVVDLFDLHPDQWRDRLVFDGSWRTIQKVDVEYSNGTNSFDISFNDKFFLVNGESPQDSTKVIDYLNQFEYFQANEMISKGRFPEFDSLMNTQPLATIELDDIKSDVPTTLAIFLPLDGQRYHLIVKDGIQQMVVDGRRVNSLLRRP